MRRDGGAGWSTGRRAYGACIKFMLSMRAETLAAILLTGVPRFNAHDPAEWTTALGWWSRGSWE
jgi:hypothetical protein